LGVESMSATIEAIKCWACPRPAVEPDYPAPAYCEEHAAKYPASPGVVVHR